MRNLTLKQKNILKKWYKENKENLKPCCFDKVDELPSKIYEELEKIHDTEILYQNINSYLGDLCFGNIK